MADTKEELTSIRMLIEQNGEILKMMCMMMEREEEKGKQETERFSQLMELIQLTGALDLIKKRLAEPRLVKPKEATADGPDQKTEESVG